MPELTSEVTPELMNKTVYRLCGEDVVCVLDNMGITMSPEQLEELTEYLIRKLDIPWTEYIQVVVEHYLSLTE